MPNSASARSKHNCRKPKPASRRVQSRIGYKGSGDFDPAKLPEVAAQRANYESAIRAGQLAEADAQRYGKLGRQR